MTRYSPTHPITLKLRPSRARNGGRRRGLPPWVRFEGVTARQQRRRENQHAKLFNHVLTPFPMVRHLAVKDQGGAPSGGVLDLDFMESHREPKLIAIDEQTNNDVVQFGRFGKADRFASEPLDTGTHEVCH